MTTANIAKPKVSLGIYNADGTPITSLTGLAVGATVYLNVNSNYVAATIVSLNPFTVRSNM